MVAFGMLGRYFGRRFITAVMVAFLTCVILIAIVDFFELTRRMGDRPETGQIGYLVFLRLPSFTEQMLPFATLIGAMSAFLALSRRLEFVVARASGVSAWQFIGSAIVLALVLGGLATAVFNPISASMKETADRIESEMLSARFVAMGGRQKTVSNIWVRQRGENNQAIISAAAASNQGRLLTGVRIFVFDLKGDFVERIEAKSAELQTGAWRLSEVSIFSPTNSPKTLQTHLLPTSLTPDQVRGTFSNAAALSFWELPGAIELVRAAGLSAARYEIQYQLLLARPLLLVTMVLIAAAVSLRVFRLGGVGKMITIGVLSGFGIYVASQLSEQLGEGGFLNPIVAGWLPVVCAAMVGCTILLHQEDG
jgi:lipopolysaccharide export system permease protein